MRLINAALTSLLFTIFGGSFYYAISVVLTLSKGGDVVQTFSETVQGCFLLWVILTFVFYEIAGAFAELNKPRNKSADRNDQDHSGPKYN